jgi:hypothetical protein
MERGDRATFRPVTSDTWPRRLAMAAAIAGGVAILGGCGAGGPDVAAFDRQANRICSALTHRLAALPRPPSDPATLVRKDEVGLKARRRLDVYARRVDLYVEQTLRQLRDLKPPSSVANPWNAWLHEIDEMGAARDAAFRAQEALLRALRSGGDSVAADERLAALNARADRHLARANRLARKVGAQRCVDVL